MVCRGSGPFMLVSSTDSCGANLFRAGQEERRCGKSFCLAFFCLLSWVLIHFLLEVEAALGLFGLVPRAGHGSSGPLAGGENGDVGPDSDKSG